MTLLVRRARDEDLEMVAAWEADNRSGATWTIKDLSEEFSHPKSCFWVATEGGEPCGYCVARHLPDGFELLSILVPLAYRRRGVARQLMAALHALSGTESVYLEVRASNEAAQALYAAFGYEQIGVRARYYRDGEDAVLMSREPN